MGSKTRPSYRVIFTSTLIVSAILGAVTHIPTEMLTSSSPQFSTRGGDWMRHKESVYSERRKRIRSVCERYKKVWQKTDFPGREFLYDLRNGLAYCRHEKVRRGS